MNNPDSFLQLRVEKVFTNDYTNLIKLHVPLHRIFSHTVVPLIDRLTELSSTFNTVSLVPVNCDAE